jgi:CubicO group peptidase (beta-lactamase class C family)
MSNTSNYLIKNRLTMKSLFDKKQCYPLLIIIITLLFLYPANSFSQDEPSKNKDVADSVAINMVNDFIMAVNSGERKPMEDFILHHYDQNALNRIPLFAVVSLNLSYFYESAGLGFNFVKMIPSEENMVSAELYNCLTETTLKFDFPVSGAPLYKINRFIKAVPAKSERSEEVVKHFSNQEIISRIEKCLKKLEEDEEFSGTVLVAKNGDILFKTAIGDASKAYEIPNNFATKFNIASVGKMFTGLAITQLVEQGKLSFDDPLSKYVSEDWLSKEVSEKIQIKHLLTHTSGLGDYFRDAYQQCDIPFFRNLEDYKSLIADDTLMFEPGSRFSYSNTGMLLLGVVIEKVTNEEYFKYLKNNIFEPVGMMNTDGFDKDSPVINRATGYTKVYENGNVTWNNHQFTRIMRGSPSGGIYSTIDDMLKFDFAIRSNKLLSPEYTEILLEGRPELNASFHSYGFFVSEGDKGRVASHKGDGRGMNCQFKTYLDSGYTIIVLSNYSQPSANMVANVIEQLITK